MIAWIRKNYSEEHFKRACEMFLEWAERKGADKGAVYYHLKNWALDKAKNSAMLRPVIMPQRVDKLPDYYYEGELGERLPVAREE